jgi:acyl carrier protein
MSTRDQVRGFISETFFVEEFADEDSFLNSRIVDSTGMMELVTFLEDQFHFKVSDGELVPENLDSVNNVCAFIARKHAAL